MKCSRTEQWLALVGALQALSSHKRLLRICIDGYFADENDIDTLPVLFPYVERLGLVVPSYEAVPVYRKMLSDLGWSKVVPVVEGNQFSSYYDFIATRWW